MKDGAVTPHPFNTRLLRRSIRDRLLPWFLRNQRDLPWRHNRTPYRVWIAELMLTQTRVDTVIPYYRRFMRRFPSMKSLAEAPQQDLLKLWEGLGYYARARNAHRAAQHIVQQLNGRFPRDINDIRALPGVGPYTAAAVASLAFNQEYAVLDGNVIRVLSRLVAYPGEAQATATRRELQALADQLLVPGHAAAYNEAMMELGALCCTPRNPLCAGCPLRTVCAAYGAGNPTAYPRRRATARVPHKEVGAAVVANRAGAVLIAQRLETAMLGGLWEFPGGTLEPGETMPECIRRELQEELGVEITVGERIMVVKHAYSHFTIALHVHAARIKQGRPRAIECADFRWVPISDLRRFPFSRADLHVVDKLQRG